MVKLASKRKTYLDAGLLKPISENYLFTNAGLYLLIGSIGSGKSYFISRHILYTDQLVNETTGEKGFYRSVIIITSGNKSDETTESFLKGVKNTIIVRVSEMKRFPFSTSCFGSIGSITDCTRHLCLSSLNWMKRLNGFLKNTPFPEISRSSAR